MTYIYQTVNPHQMFSMFEKMGRANADGFTLDAVKLIHAHLEDLAHDQGSPIEFDVIGICCEWSEYDDLAVLIDDFDLDIISLYESDVDEDEYARMVKDSLEEKDHYVLHDGGCCWVVSS